MVIACISSSLGQIRGNERDYASALRLRERWRQASTIRSWGSATCALCVAAIPSTDDLPPLKIRMEIVLTRISRANRQAFGSTEYATGAPGNRGRLASGSERRLVHRQYHCRLRGTRSTTNVLEWPCQGKCPARTLNLSD